MELPVQFDNINRRVVDDLKEKLTAASSLRRQVFPSMPLKP